MEKKLKKIKRALHKTTIKMFKQTDLSKKEVYELILKLAKKYKYPLKIVEDGITLLKILLNEDFIEYKKAWDSYMIPSNEWRIWDR